MAAVADGSAQLVVGTHAVIQEKVVFHRLGLAIVDEQHRFGVQQRLALRQKLRADEAGDAGGGRRHDGGGCRRSGCGRRDADRRATLPPRPRCRCEPRPRPRSRRAPPCTAAARSRRRPTAPSTPLEPHLLMMSATPIPRTLAMSYYADLAVSTIDELPPGRTPVVTKLFADARRDEVVDRIRDEAARGRQVYWVCPLIEESEALDLRNATETHRQLCEAFGDEEAAAGRAPRFVGLLHGRLPAGREGGGDGALRRRRAGGAGGHHGDRGRRRRAQRQPDGGRACRTLRPEPAAPAARPRRPRRGEERLRAALHAAARPAARASG